MRNLDGLAYTGLHHLPVGSHAYLLNCSTVSLPPSASLGAEVAGWYIDPLVISLLIPLRTRPCPTRHPSFQPTRSTPRFISPCSQNHRGHIAYHTQDTQILEDAQGSGGSCVASLSRGHHAESSSGVCSRGLKGNTYSRPISNAQSLHLRLHLPLNRKGQIRQAGGQSSSTTQRHRRGSPINRFPHALLSCSYSASISRCLLTFGRRCFSVPIFVPTLGWKTFPTNYIISRFIL